MSRGRKILLVVFIVTSVLGMWARHAYQKAEQRKRERMFATLSEAMRRREREAEEARAAAERENHVEETRDMFDSALPQESYDLIRQAVGQDFRLLEVWFNEKGVMAKVSTDGQTVSEYRKWKDRKGVEGPLPVQLTGDGKLEDNLLKAADLDLSLVPKLAREAKERAALPDSKVSTLRLNFPFIRYEGEGPEWTAMVEAGKPGENWQNRHVTFDTKGKLKKVYD